MKGTPASAGGKLPGHGHDRRPLEPGASATMKPRTGFLLWPAAALVGWLVPLWALYAQVTITIDTSPAGQRQVIDGFGTCLYGTEPAQTWWQSLYYGDLRASMLRMDLTPVFNSSYSDNEYNSPGYAQAGPNGNYVRTYTNATTYTNVFAGRQAKIAVMGPDINSNIAYFDFTASGFNADGSNLQVAGQAAQAGKSRFNTLGDFKLFATILSPAPWLKLADGNVYAGGNGANYPAVNTPFPFIWLGNFAGGVLDTSGTARAEFDDSSLGGSGPTSALTQFARGTAAYLRGFQNAYGVPLYAISIQNELNFDEFYHSCYYPSAAGYLAAIKAVRAELDNYPDLAGIKIMGPEDILEVDAYGLWQYGSGSTAAAKNLQFLEAVGADPGAAAALDFFCIHGYSFTSYDAQAFDTTQTLWDWWANGWGASPAPGIPANVEGFTDYGKKSWQTEFSGDDPAWLSPSSGFPGDGAWAMALRIQQALTVGRESAWAYSRLADGNPVTSDLQVLTDSTSLQNSPKYVAAKHFFRYIRPNSLCVNASLTGSTALTASAFLNTTNATMTVVLINSSNGPVHAVINSPAQPAGIPSWQTFTSSNGSYWQVSTTPIANGSANVSIPGYGVVTLYGVAPSGLSLTWNIPAAITYGTALGSNQLNATANVPGTFAYAPTNGAVLNAGTNTLSVIFTPTDTVGYPSVTGTVSLVVSPALLTVTAANASRAYGQANPVFVGTVTGVADGDQITASYGCIAASTTQAGTYSIVPSLVDPDNRQSNYTVSLINGTFTITAAVPLLAWTASPAITYGTGLSSLQLNATASVPGAFAYSPPAGTVLSAGTAQLYVLFSPDDAADYITASATVNLAVLKAPLALTAANATRTYGTSNPSFTGTILGLVNGDSISAAYACAATPTSLPGAYPIVPTLVDPNNQQVNYSVTLSDGTLTVAPASAPTLFSATPDTGLTNGGATITILGTGFENGATVAFGTNTASTVGFINSTNLTVLTPPSVPGTVDVIVTNADGQVATLTNGFTYGVQPFITSQPSNQAAMFGTGIQFSVLAGGTQPLSYQWQFNGTNLTDNARITGSQSNLLAVGSVGLGDAGPYQVVVTNQYGSATSAVATLAVVAPPVFQTVKETGGVLTLTWSATAGQPYQVQYKTNLSQPNWASLAAVTATNSTATASDALIPSAQRFYRVTWLPYR